MKTLLILALGLLCLFAAAAGAVRQGASRRKGEARLLVRLQAMQRAAEPGGVMKPLFGPESGPRFLRLRFARADVQLERRTVNAGLAIALAGVGLIAVMHQFAAALAAAPLAAVVAFLVLDRIAWRNVSALRRDLPFLLDGVRQNLTVGASLQQALIRGVEQAGPDVRRYFLPPLRRMQNGATVEESLAWLADRLELPEIDMLSVAVHTNIRFGGAMSPSLLNLSQILRDRARVGRELRAATSETRMSGWVLAGLPILAIFGVAFMNPVYATFLTRTPTGQTMLAVAFGLQGLGCLMMARIMRLDF